METGIVVIVVFNVVAPFNQSDRHAQTTLNEAYGRSSYLFVVHPREVKAFLRYLAGTIYRFRFPCLVERRLCRVGERVVTKERGVFFFHENSAGHAIAMVRSGLVEQWASATIKVDEACTFVRLCLPAVLDGVRGFEFARRVCLTLHNATCFLARRSVYARAVVVMTSPFATVAIVNVSFRAMCVVFLNYNGGVDTFLLVHRRDRNNAHSAYRAGQIPIVYGHGPPRELYLFRTAMCEAGCFLTRDALRTNLCFQ